MERELDIVVYGSSGFTGKLVARYLLESVQRTGARIGLAGRSFDKLKAARDEILLSSPASASLDPPLIAADDDESLCALAGRTSVVISTAGPFALCGTPLEAACVQSQTNCALLYLNSSRACIHVLFA